jgi:hypothetical protein
MAACLWNADRIFNSPNVYCDPQGRLTELMASALAAVLAFIGGSKWHGPDRKDGDGPKVLPKAPPQKAQTQAEGDEHDQGKDGSNDRSRDRSDRGP